MEIVSFGWQALLINNKSQFFHTELVLEGQVPLGISLYPPCKQTLTENVSLVAKHCEYTEKPQNFMLKNKVINFMHILPQ